MKKNATTWVPSPRQARVLEAAQEAGLDRNITTVCASAGIAPSTFYRWLERDPGFVAAWESIWRGTIRRHLPGVVAAVIHQAQRGDVQAAKLVADLAGVLKGQETNVQVVVSQDRPPTLRELIANGASRSFAGVSPPASDR